MAAVAGGAWINTARRAGGIINSCLLRVVEGADDAWRAGGVTGLHGRVDRRMVGPDVSSKRLAARSRILARILSGVNGAGGGALGGRQHRSKIAWKRSSSSISFAICAWSDMSALRNTALY